MLGGLQGKTLARSSNQKNRAATKLSLPHPGGLASSRLTPGVWHLREKTRPDLPRPGGPQPWPWTRVSGTPHTGEETSPCHQTDMRDEVWLLLIGITMFAVVFDRLLALWDRHRVRRKLLRALMSHDGGSFIQLSHHNAGDDDK
jgi:hypothetical protein